MSAGVAKVGPMYQQPSTEFQAERATAKAQGQIDKGSPYTPERRKLKEVSVQQRAEPPSAAQGAMFRMPGGTQRTQRGGDGGGGSGGSRMSLDQLRSAFGESVEGGTTPPTPASHRGLPAVSGARPMPAARLAVAHPMGSGPIIDV